MNKNLKEAYKRILSNKLINEATAPPRGKGGLGPRVPSGIPDGLRAPALSPHGRTPTGMPNRFYIPLKTIDNVFDALYGHGQGGLYSMEWWEQLLRMTPDDVDRIRYGRTGNRFVDRFRDPSNWLARVEDYYRGLIGRGLVDDLYILRDGRVVVRNKETGEWHFMDPDGNLGDVVPRNPDGSLYRPGQQPPPGDPPREIDPETGRPIIPLRPHHYIPAVAPILFTEPMGDFGNPNENPTYLARLSGNETGYA